MGIERTKDVDTLKKSIVNHRWWRLFHMAWKDGETTMQKLSTNMDSVLPKKTTQRREWGVMGSNVGNRPLSKSAHSELTHDFEVNYWSFLPWEHWVLPWQLFQTVQERVIVGSPDIVGWRDNLYLSIQENEVRQMVAFIRRITSQARTSSAKCGEAITDVRISKGPSRSLNHETYARKNPPNHQGSKLKCCRR